jgi:hypothetical protein
MRSWQGQPQGRRLLRPLKGRASPLRLSSAQASTELRLRTEPVEVTGPAPMHRLTWWIETALRSLC